MIIGVSGKKRSGKDTFYNLLKNEIQGEANVKRYAFADHVKELAIKYFDIPTNQIKFERHRYILQGLGQIFREEVSKTFWIDYVINQINESRKKDPKEISVITDVRYLNESEAILAQDHSILIKIHNPISEFWKDSHQSENDLNDYEFDFQIENSEDLGVYQKRVKEWVLKNYSLIIPW